MRGRLYLPNQHHESHHKICNLRYRTHGYGMSAYEITAKDRDPRNIMNGLSIAVSYARQHKLPYAFLTDKMLEETVDVQRMEQMLPEALEKREFQVYYQPKVESLPA